MYDGRVFASRDLRGRQRRSQQHVFSIETMEGRARFGEALIFATRGHEAFVVCDELIITSPVADLRASLARSPLPASNRLSQTLSVVEGENPFYLRVLGSLPSLIPLRGRVLCAARVDLLGSRFVTSIVDRI